MSSNLPFGIKNFIGSGFLKSLPDTVQRRSERYDMKLNCEFPLPRRRLRRENSPRIDFFPKGEENHDDVAANVEELLRVLLTNLNPARADINGMDTKLE